MSFPPGTEMFQFPGFASTAYVFSCRYPKGVGCPIRTSTDQRLLAAPRGFSQRATSFIASWCQGIHRMPFLCSRASKPPRGSLTPCTGTIPSSPGSPIPGQQGRPRPRSLLLSTQHITPLNADLVAGGQTKVEHVRPKPNQPVRHRNQARPETHQNLIHRDKEQNRHAHSGAPLPGPPNSPAQRRSKSNRPETLTSPRYHPYPAPPNGGDDRVRTDDPLLAKQVLSQLSYVPRCRAVTGPDRTRARTPNTGTRLPNWWAREDLNLRPHAYQACALTS